MTRKPGYPLYGKRYCGNFETKKLHDIDNISSECRISEIIEEGNAVVFTPDTLSKAYIEGYIDCKYCLGKNSG